ncbi:hypothetical protein [Streptomyces heilongjiangensis]|uniref:HTH-like domain-containing protein n=1 Tax=Streptomyces heilongjiangensis TaxID=945052 RepID=A0ABW1BJW2_9ACTN
MRRPGRRVNRKRVARVMRERDIRGVTRRRRRSLTRPDARAKFPHDLEHVVVTPRGLGLVGSAGVSRGV